MIDLMDIEIKFLGKKFNKWDIFKYFIKESVISIYDTNLQYWKHGECLKVICIKFKNDKIRFCINKEKKIKEIY
jgi:hypothetical protein